MPIQLSQLNPGVLKGPGYELPALAAPLDFGDPAAEMQKAIETSAVINQKVVEDAKLRALQKKMPVGYTKFDEDTVDAANKAGININSYIGADGRFDLAKMRDALSAQKVAEAKAKTANVVATKQTMTTPELASSPEELSRRAEGVILKSLSEVLKEDPARVAAGGSTRIASDSLGLAGEFVATTGAAKLTAAVGALVGAPVQQRTESRNAAGELISQEITSVPATDEDKLRRTGALQDVNMMPDLKVIPPLVRQGAGQTDSPQVIAAKANMEVGAAVDAEQRLRSWADKFAKGNTGDWSSRFDAALDFLGISDEAEKRRAMNGQDRALAGRAAWTALLDLPTRTAAGELAPVSELQQLNPFKGGSGALDALLPDRGVGPELGAEMINRVADETKAKGIEKADNAVRQGLFIEDEYTERLGVLNYFDKDSGTWKLIPESADVDATAATADNTSAPVEVTDPKLAKSVLDAARAQTAKAVSAIKPPAPSASAPAPGAPAMTTPQYAGSNLGAVTPAPVNKSPGLLGELGNMAIRAIGGAPTAREKEERRRMSKAGNSGAR